MRFRNVLPTLALAATSVCAFAEGESSTPQLDTSEVVNAATSIKTGLVSILGDLSPLVIAVVVAGVAIWAIPRIVGILKTGFTSGKGR